VPLAKGESELVQRTAEPLEEQSAARHIVPQEPRAALTVGKAQDRDFVPRGVTGPWDEQLQYSGSAVGEGYLSNERLGPVTKWTTNADRPLPLEASDERREFVEPRCRADGNSLIAHDDWYADHHWHSPP
jgi:hypothetical protein